MTARDQSVERDEPRAFDDPEGIQEVGAGEVERPSTEPDKPKFSSEEHRAKATKQLALLLF